MKLSTAVLMSGIVLLVVLFTSMSNAQVSGLIFSQSSGTYTAISGGTVLGTTSSDDQYYVDPAVPAGGFTATGPGFPIGFNFNYNGHVFDRFGVQNNGWIALGNSALTPSVDMGSTSTYTPLSSTAVNTPDYLRSRIAGLGVDLQAQTSPASDLEFAVSGSPGSQVLTVQWTTFRKYSASGDNFSFQIRLFEGTNKVEIVYGTVTSNTTSTTVQAGLGGTLSTDFNNRTTATDWTATTAGVANTDACALVNTVVPPSGLTFDWMDVSQTYTSSTTTQNTLPVLSGAGNAQIIGVQVVMAGSVSPLSATSFTLNTNGTTSTSDISNAKLWFTGTNPVFAMTSQFGSTVPAPSGSFNITGTQVLAGGTNYFWLTYDVSGGATPGHLIDAECNSLTVGSAHTPTVTAPAGARTVVAPLSGTKTVGTAGDYATLIDAASAVNTVGLGGNLTLNIISDLTDTAVVINQWAEAGGGGYRLTIKPSGAPRTIAGNSPSAVIKLNGADRVTIDGSTSGGTDRSLTITNARLLASTAVIQLASQGTGLGATDNIIKNCNLAAGINSTTTYGIVVGGASVGSAGNDNDNLTIQNNAISNAYYGIWALASSAGPNDNLTILGNSIGSAVTATQIGYTGIYVGQGTGGVISENTIYNIIGTITTPAGIQVQTGFVSATISRNNINNITYTGTGGYGGRGLYVSTGNPASSLTIANNEISVVGGDGYTSFSFSSPVGMYFDGASGGFNIYFNSVYMSGNLTYNAATLTTGILFNTTTITGVDLRNNVFQNSMFNGSNAGAKNYAIYSTAPASAFTNIDYNDYYVTGTQGILGYLGADQATLAAWRTATTQDVHSLSGDPLFTTTTNLTPQFGSPLLAAGVAGTGITIDFLGNTRGTPPTIGAFENAVGDILGPFVVYTPLTGTGSTSNRTLTAVVTDPSGVAGAGNAPRIYYRKGGSGAYVFANATTVADSHYTFTINYAAIGGITQGDTVQYYVAAQDQHGPANVSTNPAGGSGINPPGTTPPSAPNSYMILVTVSSFPHTQDFEGTALGWTTGIFSGSINEWVIGTPAKPHIAGAHSGTKAYTTTITGSYSASENAYVQSPIFDMTSLTAAPTLAFWHNFYSEPGWDAGILEVSSDGGLTWSRVDSTLGTGGNYTTAISFNWYNSNSTSGPITPNKWSGYDTVYVGNSGGWIRSTTKLVGFAGLPDVRFRWRFGSDASVQYEGWAIDDVSILPALNNDIAAASVDDPSAGGSKRVNTAFSPKATFTNTGALTQTSIPVRLKIFDGTSALVYTNNQTIASLAADISQQVTFSGFTPTTTGSYTARAIALNPGDLNGLNDSVTVTFSVIDVPQFLVRPDSLVKSLNGGQRDSILFYMRNAGGVSGNFNASAIMYPPASMGGKPGQPVRIPMVVVPAKAGGGHSDLRAAKNKIEPSAIRSPGFSVSKVLLNDTLHYDGPNGNSIGTGGAITFTVAARFTPTELGSYYGYNAIQTVMLWVAQAYTSCTVKVWQGGSVGNPGTEVYSQPISPVLNVWTYHQLPTPIPLVGGNEYWIGYEVSATTGYPAGCDAGPQIPDKSQWTLWSGTWVNLIDLNPALTYNWNLRMVLVQTSAPWLSVAPTSGTIAVADSVLMKGYFDASDTALSNHPGNYYGRIEVTAVGSPLADVLRIPTRLTVGSGTSTVNVNTGITNGWNMIANPVTDPVPNDSTKRLFPTIISRAFRFFNGYIASDTMHNGVGYWGKFPAATTNTITGTARTRDSMSVLANWNMVGSISNPVDTNTIVSVPPGIRASNWFGWGGAGYIVVTQITPGKAYWIKTNAAGKFVMANPLVSGPAKEQGSGGVSLDALNTLTVTDSKGGSQTLYFGADAKKEIPLPMFDMPPAPPVGALDARFETAEGGSMVRTHELRVSDPLEFPVRIQSDAYPVTVSWKMNGGTASYELTDGQSGRVFRAKEMTAEGSIKITNSELSRFSVRLVGDGTLPADYSLSQNYPNPFNPTTSIKYALPVDSKVTAYIYNLLGQRVRTLVNDNIPAGYHTTEWDGTGNGGQHLASGAYFLQLSASGTNGKTFNEIKKLLLLK